MTAPPGTNSRPRTAVDCVVVGGGPVGLLTAVFLGQAGLTAAVIERQPQRYPLPGPAPSTTSRSASCRPPG
ncbi:MAG: FAD-dependent monooxygenase [Nakamurella sp.]